MWTAGPCEAGVEPKCSLCAPVVPEHILVQHGPAFRTEEMSPL